MGQHAIACGLDGAAHGRDRRPCRLLLRRHEQGGRDHRPWPCRRRRRREHDVGHRARQRQCHRSRRAPPAMAGSSSSRAMPSVALRHLDEGHRHRGRRLGRPHVGLHGASAAISWCCGDAGEALGDSIYEARLYVRGKVASLGADCIEKEMRQEHRRRAGAPARAAPEIKAEPRGLPPLRFGAQAL